MFEIIGGMFLRLNYYDGWKVEEKLAKWCLGSDNINLKVIKEIWAIMTIWLLIAPVSFYFAYKSQKEEKWKKAIIHQINLLLLVVVMYFINYWIANATGEDKKIILAFIAYLAIILLEIGLRNNLKDRSSYS